jgi:hypothetical protein
VHDSGVDGGYAFSKQRACGSSQSAATARNVIHKDCAGTFRQSRELNSYAVIAKAHLPADDPGQFCRIRNGTNPWRRLLIGSDNERTPSGALNPSRKNRRG